MFQSPLIWGLTEEVYDSLFLHQNDSISISLTLLLFPSCTSYSHYGINKSSFSSRSLRQPIPVDAPSFCLFLCHFLSQEYDRGCGSCLVSYLRDNVQCFLSSLFNATGVWEPGVVVCVCVNPLCMFIVCVNVCTCVRACVCDWSQRLCSEDVGAQ
jgi:hypothetical protein